jgi:hypothetical protein
MNTPLDAQPNPEVLCAVIAERLPLLRSNDLSAPEAALAREHIAACFHCRSVLVQYDLLAGALRRHFGSGPRVPQLPPFEEMALRALRASPVVRGGSPSSLEEDSSQRESPVWAVSSAATSPPLLARLFSSAASAQDVDASPFPEPALAGSSGAVADALHRAYAAIVRANAHSTPRGDDPC